jgi:hypothetical protein
MPNINDVFPSKYLKTSDLGGTEPIVTIDRVEWQPVGHDREMKAVLYFVGKKKAIVLNKTMANKLVEITGGAITEEWAGAKVQLFSAEATFGGDTYDVVRMRAVPHSKPKMARMTKPDVPTPKAPDVSDDDSAEMNADAIPF